MTVSSVFSTFSPKSGCYPFVKDGQLIDPQ